MTALKNKYNGNVLNVFYVLSALAIFTSMVVLTYMRNDLWLTKLSIWIDTAQKSPVKARVHGNVGVAYKLIGKYDEALSEYKKANDLDYRLLVIYSNLFDLGVTYEKQGIYYQAAICYDLICSKAPSLFRKEKLFACDRANRFQVTKN